MRMKLLLLALAVAAFLGASSAEAIFAPPCSEICGTDEVFPPVVIACARICDNLIIRTTCHAYLTEPCPVPP